MSDSKNAKGRKKPRSIMADDSQWQLIANRAGAAWRRLVEEAEASVAADEAQA